MTPPPPESYILLFGSPVGSKRKSFSRRNATAEPPSIFAAPTYVTVMIITTEIEQTRRIIVYPFTFTQNGILKLIKKKFLPSELRFFFVYVSFFSRQESYIDKILPRIAQSASGLTTRREEDYTALPGTKSETNVKLETTDLSFLQWRRRCVRRSMNLVIW